MENIGFLIIAVLTVVGFGCVFLYFMLSNIKEERLFKEQLQDFCSKRNCTLSIQPEPKVSYMMTGEAHGRKWVLKNYTHENTQKLTKGPNDSDLVFTAHGITNPAVYRISDKITTDSPQDIKDFVKGCDSKGTTPLDSLQKIEFGMSEEFKNEFISYSAPGAAIADAVDSDVQKLMLRHKVTLRKPNFELLSLDDCLIIRSNSTYNLQELDAVLSLGVALLKRAKQ